MHKKPGKDSVCKVVIIKISERKREGRVVLGQSPYRYETGMPIFKLVIILNMKQKKGCIISDADNRRQYQLPGCQIFVPD